jgi:urea transporter
LVYLAHAVLNSYAMLFFSNQKLFGALILIVSFLNPYTGIGGLSATIIAVIAAYGIGFSSDQVKTGFYTYSALLLGLGMGTFYELSMGYWLLLPLASLVAVLVSAALIAKLGKQNLPALSLSFILTFWLVILASKEFTAVGLTQRNIYWLNEMYATGGSKLIQLIQHIDSLDIPDAVAGFLRSLSAILFQSNIAAGILLVIGLLIYSRIALLLSILGYATAMIFISLMGAGGGGINYYNVGTNFMLVAIALGGFYIIPSTRSFLWAIITVPISYLLVLGLSKITYTWGLPVFSLPFCITVILFLYCLQLRKTPGELVLTPVQYYSPEINLYAYINEKERWMNTVYHQLALPFMGEWMVSQGYDGDLTHKGDWAKALDFVILDNEMKTYRFPGNLPEHFYCYNKPVLAPADGTVVEIIDFIEDNEIGGNNTQQNWGNTIVIKHAEGLYTKLSHLKKHSFKVAKGAFVKKGEIIAHVGNSGRSPEPHLHFQVQANPYVGSKTISYPFAYFTVRENSNILLNNFKIPKEGSFISNIIGNDQLQQAFNFQPGLLVKVNAKDFQEEEWEVFTSVYNETYFYCKQTKAAAYFKHNGNAFYFTHFMGEKNNLLFYFYEAAYKVLLSSENKINVKDNFPLSVYSLNAVKWLQDLLSPFYIFINMQFQSEVKKDSNALTGNSISFTSKKLLNLFGKEKHLSTAHVKIENNRLHSFTVQTNNKTIAAICTV